MKHETIQSPAYVRVSGIVRKHGSSTPPLLPVSAATWWSWVKSGKAPAPIKLSPGCTVWRYADVIAFAESLAEGE
jgi:prophage regulatory protein